MNDKERSIAAVQEQMASGQLSSQELVVFYLQRIDLLDRNGPTLKSILDINPEAMEIAANRDRERATSGPRGPLHGIPIILKANIDTADQMPTTAGSAALKDHIATKDFFVARKLREAGALILGKSNLSEWANFRSTRSSSGWSSLGGQTRNPYALDRNPCGSSSGSAVAVAVEDAAILLGAMSGVDHDDPPAPGNLDHMYKDYTQFLDPNGLQGARIGVARNFFGFDPRVDQIMEQSVAILKQQGADVIDPANIAGIDELHEPELELLLYEFKDGLNKYLAALPPHLPVHSLAELISYNQRNHEQIMPYFGQELLLDAKQKGPLTEPAYRELVNICQRLSQTEGIDATMATYELDAVIGPTGGPAWLTDLINGDHFAGSCGSTAAVAGYPHITVPAGFIFGLPIGLSFFGRAFQEPTLFKIAYAFEQATHARRPPTFLPTITQS